MSNPQILNLGIDLGQDSFEAALAPEHPETEACFASGPST
jgi:hypothetical protein